ncbi:MAG: Asp-tRNA(Asn)/Glu-tRNA(Gln) amidotransferase subunit GatA, partial [Clostridia bacterium]|nr:Asp-tRNA(Asn)/Glu-tRNA(Gln) amidotransferase subunit GatA [Clostridia bacterium]
MKDVISTLSKKLQSKDISSVELTKQYIEKIEKQNATINAYVHTTFDTALKQAEYADKLIKEGKATPVTGIP